MIGGVVGGGAVHGCLDYTEEVLLIEHFGELGLVRRGRVGGREIALDARCGL